MNQNSSRSMRIIRRGPATEYTASTAAARTDIFFASCPRGLEPLLSEDLTACGARDIQIVPGGAHFKGDWRVCYSANLESRIATRILWRVGHGAYRREDDIYDFARSLKWHRWFHQRNTLRVYVTAVRSPLKSLEFVTLRIKDAVCDVFRDQNGERPTVDTTAPDVRIHAFLSESEVTLYLDTSGEPLYIRGFKHAKVGAPIKENLAAGILRLTGWKPGTPFLDPMCGSGTFLIEAAQMALDIAPGLQREFAFEKLTSFSVLLWREIREAAAARRKPVTLQPIFGSDLDDDAIARAGQNLAVAGLTDAVHVRQGDLLTLAAPAETGIMVANPPYGERLGDKNALIEFYPDLGDSLKKHFPGWNCFFISADTELPRHIGLKAARRTPLYNGALECRLYEYRMVSGSARRPEPA